MIIRVKGKGNCSGPQYSGDRSNRDGVLVLESIGEEWKVKLLHEGCPEPIVTLTLTSDVSIEGYDESRTYFLNFTSNGCISLNFGDKVYIRFVISDYENQRDQLLVMSAFFEHQQELKPPVKVRPQVSSKDFPPTTPTNCVHPQEPVPSETPANKLSTNDVPLKMSPQSTLSPPEEILSKDQVEKEVDVTQLAQTLSGEKELPRLFLPTSTLSPSESYSVSLLNKKYKSQPDLGREIRQDTSQFQTNANYGLPKSTGPKFGRLFSFFDDTIQNDSKCKHKACETIKPVGPMEMKLGFKDSCYGAASLDQKSVIPPPPPLRKRSSSVNIRQPQTKKSKESETVKGDKFDFDTTGDTAAKENYPPSEIGLHNLGRTCYMNCTIQAVLSLDSLMNQLKNGIQTIKERRISRPLLRLFENRWNKCDAKKRAYLEDFWQMMVATTRMFVDPNVMEDSHEFLGKMFAVLDNEWGRSSNNIINHNIGLDVKTSYDCPCCHKSTDKMDRVNDLSLSFPEKNTHVSSSLQLKQLLDEYFYRCVMDCSCSCLDKPREVSAFNQITRISPVVIIQLKRYFVKAGTACKNTTPVSIPIEIDLKKYYYNKSTSENTLNNDGNDAISTGDSTLIVREKIKSDSFNGGTDIKEDERLLYTLRSVIEHSGNDTNKGHYITRTKWCNEWYKCDDTTVSRVDFGSIQEDDAYILFYVRATSQS